MRTFYIFTSTGKILFFFVCFQNKNYSELLEFPKIHNFFVHKTFCSISFVSSSSSFVWSHLTIYCCLSIELSSIRIGLISKYSSFARWSKRYQCRYRNINNDAMPASRIDDIVLVAALFAFCFCFCGMKNTIKSVDLTLEVSSRIHYIQSDC